MDTTNYVVYAPADAATALVNSLHAEMGDMIHTIWQPPSATHPPLVGNARDFRIG